MATDLELLQNKADLIGLKIEEEPITNKEQKTTMYFASTKGHLSCSPVLNYENMNNFLLGWIRCSHFYKIIKS